MNTPNIGQLIKEEVERQGLTTEEFAEKCGFEVRNAYKIYKKNSINTAQLGLFCKKLNHDFFQDIVNHPEILKLDDPEIIAEIEEKRAKSQFVELMPSVLKKLHAIPLVSFGLPDQFGSNAPVPDFYLPAYRISFSYGKSMKEKLIGCSFEGMQVICVSDHKGKDFDVFMDVQNNEIILMDVPLVYKTEKEWVDMMAYVLGYLFHDGFREDKLPEFRNGNKQLEAFYR